MTRKSFAAGETVFREGEVADTVGYVIEGEAEVLKHHGDETVVLGHVGAGEYIGEMAAIEMRPHAATVRATGALTLDVVPSGEFLSHASEDGELARKLLYRLSSRLQRLDRAYAELAASTGTGVAEPPAAAAAGPGRTVRLLPGSPRMQPVLAELGGPEIALPFVVGRTPAPDEMTPMQQVALQIRDMQPYRLSRAHFEIEERHGQIGVHDLNSHLGTIVNDEPLGASFGDDWTPLRSGENTVIAGGITSPYVFTVVLDG